MITKKFFYLILLLSIHLCIKAQESSDCPINKEFTKHFEKNNNSLKSSSVNEPGLGLTPTPFTYHFSKSSTKLKSENIPSSYDLREIDGGAYLTSVKNQGTNDVCWTFATFGSIESYILKHNNDSYDFSEQNLATCHGFDYEPNHGGNYLMSSAYLTRHSGPILESDDEYTIPIDDCSCKDNLTPAIYIEQAVFLPGSDEEAFDTDNIKQAIIDNGALYVNMYWDNAYSNDYNNADNYVDGDHTYYYSGDESTNHAVVLVGWDDDKVVTGGISSSTPTSSGAWIIKNSWGSDWGESGYFYISYEDTKALSSIAYFPSAVNYDSNINAYYYDKCGQTSATGYGSESAYALIKYTTSTNETLEKIGTYAVASNTTIKIDVYGEFDETTQSLSDYLGGINSVTCSNPGFYTFDIDDDIELNSNTDFYIKVHYQTEDYNYPIPMETQIDDYTEGITIESDKCWINSNPDTYYWTSIGSNTSKLKDLCIKAYTSNSTVTAISDNINENSDDVKIFPNPTDGILFINFCEQNIKPNTISIIDISGNEIYSTCSINETNQLKIDLSNQKDGIYIIKLLYSNTTKTYKVIKQ